MRSTPFALHLAVAIGMLLSTATAGLIPFSEASAGQNDEKAYEHFDPDNFDDPTNIDNEWYPMKPGTRLVWEGTSVDEEGEEQAHRVEFVVTDLTKVIGGVRTRVCWDLDLVEDEMVETEIVFFAQDNDGAIWSLGEYPEEYEEGEFITAPCWMHGVQEAVAGIFIPAKVKIGTQRFSQGWAPSVDFTDYGIVDEVGTETTVPFGRYDDVLVIDEWNLDEPDAHALKYYARGLGLVRVGTRGTGDQESLELVEVEQLDAEGLAKARQAALDLERRAYEISTDAYAHTEPSRLPSGEMAIVPPTQATAAPVRKITDEEASKIALKAVPGEVMDVAVERKLGKKTIVVEVITEDGAEVDVIIDMETGEVLDTDK